VIAPLKGRTPRRVAMRSAWRLRAIVVVPGAVVRQAEVNQGSSAVAVTVPGRTCRRGCVADAQAGGQEQRQQGQNRKRTPEHGIHIGTTTGDP
jgi:hypothetical protein